MSVDTGMRQSLIEAGLVDPGSGAFLSEPNFGEAVSGDAPREPLPAEDEPAPEPQEQPRQEPASQPQVQPVPSAPGGDNAPAPDSSQMNPARLGEEADPIRQEYDTTVRTMHQQAELAFAYGRTLVDDKGQRVYSDEQLAQGIGSQLQLAQQQAYLSGVMKRMEPVAKRAAAEKIAKDNGVDVEDIINEPSPVHMQARAKTIADLTRDGRFQRRKESGVDVAEGSRSFSNAIPEGLDKLSPQQKIYAGLARGDR
jgi:hypothetical protein